MSCEEGEEGESPWQSSGGLTAATLREAFAWLSGAELARAGRVCRAWRAAAADAALWRRLLRADSAAVPGQHARCESNCRSEYVRAHAGWELRARLPAGRASLTHAALSPCHAYLALATDDAVVLIWERTDDLSWRECCSRSVRARGWARVARVLWAPQQADGTDAAARAGGRPESLRLLLAGPIAITHRWELIVLQQQEDDPEAWAVSSRAGCSAGGAGCWAAADAFVALELRQLAPRHYATTVWLVAAEQETQSEYAGVTSQLLRIYNEDEATITHVAVTAAPLNEPHEEGTLDDGSAETASRLHDPALDTCEGARLQTLIAGFSGYPAAIRTWGMSALRPPPLLATVDLRARALARRTALRYEREHEPEPQPEPDAAAVRAMCTPHDRECRLPTTLAGLRVQADGRCLWACGTGARVWCLSLPALATTRQLQPPVPSPSPSPSLLLSPSPAPAPTLLDPHYVYPDTEDGFIVTPEGGRSGRAFVWSLRSDAPPVALPHAAPALAAVLMPPAGPAHDPRTVVLMLASDYLYVWRSRATPQPDETSYGELA